MKRSSTFYLILGLILLTLVSAEPATLYGQTVPSFWKINHRVIDAEYSKQLDRIITVAGTPADQLHIIDPVGGTDVAIDLGVHVPRSVSVGPDGTHALVAYDYSVIYVDLTTQAQVQWYAAWSSIPVSDVVLAGNGYAYIFPGSGAADPHIRCLNLETGTQTSQIGPSPVTSMKAKLHPNGTKVYGSNMGISPANIEKYDIDGGTAAYLYSSPYNGAYPLWGNLWISEDGLRIFTTNAGIFSSSNGQSEDIVYKGLLDVSDVGLVAHLSHSSSIRKIAAIPDNYTWRLPVEQWIIRDTETVLFDYDSLSLQAKLPFPAFPVDDKSFTSHGRFVFFNADGSKLFSIVNADSKSGLTVNSAIVTHPLGPGGRFVYTINASAGSNGTISPAGVVEVLGGDSIAFTIIPAEGYEIQDVLVDGVSVGTVTSYEFKGVLSNHTITARFWIPGEYFPLVPGSVWAYRKNGTGSEELTVLKNKTTVEGDRASIVQYSSDRSQDYYTNDDYGVRLHGGFQPRMYVQEYGYFAVRQTMMPPMTMVQGVPALGQVSHSEGSVRYQVSGLGSAEASYTADFTVTGYETVTVPAGSFEAMKLSYSLRIGTVTETGDLYLGKGVGEIKHTHKISGESTNYELTSTNSGVRDLAVTGLSAPASITLTKGVSRKTSPVKVVIQNRGLYPEIIDDLTMLSNLVQLSVESLGSCPNPVPDVSASQQKKFPITLRPKASLVVNYNVTFDCVNDPARSTAKGPHYYDYRFSAAVDRSAIDGISDGHPSDDVCPRTVASPYLVDPYPDGTIRDRGCGARKSDGTFGSEVLLDIVGPG